MTIRHFDFSFFSFSTPGIFTNWGIKNKKYKIKNSNNNVRRITTITEDTRETTFLFQCLSMALQKGNAVSFHNTMVTE